jgi:hypothetical protein
LPPPDIHQLYARPTASADRNCVCRNCVCTECAETLAFRQALRQKVRSAADGAPVPGDLAARVRTRLDTQGSFRSWTSRHWSALAAAAMFVLVAGGLAVTQTSGSRSGVPEVVMLSQVFAQTSSLLRVGLQDHIHCARFQSYPAQGPTLEALAAGLGPDFRDLVKIVHDHAPQGLQVIEARHGEQLLSLVITERGSGESLGNELKSVLSESGVNLYAANHADFQLAAFETGHYLTYLISNVSPSENVDALRAMTPALREVFRKAKI